MFQTHLFEPSCGYCTHSRYRLLSQPVCKAKKNWTVACYLMRERAVGFCGPDGKMFKRRAPKWWEFWRKYSCL